VEGPDLSALAGEPFRRPATDLASGGVNKRDFSFQQHVVSPG
jgi:hypothetical protein